MTTKPRSQFAKDVPGNWPGIIFLACLIFAAVAIVAALSGCDAS